MVSGLLNEAIKRYSTTLTTHDGEKRCLVAYLLDGDNLPSAASLISTPPLPCKGLIPSNEPSPASFTDQLTNLKEPLELPSSSSAVERIRSIVEALAVEMGIDVHILLSIILEIFGENVPLTEHTGPPLTRCVLSNSV